MVKDAGANHCVERGVRKRQRTNVGLLYVVQTALPAEGNCLRCQIDTDVLRGVAQLLQDRTCAATGVQNFLFAPIRELALQCLKDQPMQCLVPPVRLLDAKHDAIFFRLH